MKNVADTLRTPSRLWAWISGGVAAAGVVVAAVVVGPSFAATLNPAPAPTATQAEYVATLTPAESDTVQGIADEQAATIAAEQKAAAEAAAAEKAAMLSAAHQEQEGGGPIKCAYGYTANAVDGNGNESGCDKNGPGNKPCVEYTDNQCTAYLKD